MWVIKNKTGGYFRPMNYHSGFNNASRFENKRQAEEKADRLNKALLDPIFFVKDLCECL